MVKARLKSRIAVPYGGLFSLNLPDKGLVGRASSFNQLIGFIKDWRKANAYPVGLGFEDEVEREVCLAYPNECYDCDPRIPKLEVRLSVADVIQGTRMALAHKLAGSPLETQAIADSRAKICSTCPFNVSIMMPCGGICHELKNFVQTIIGSKATPYDGSLKSCAVCHCWASVMVWVPLDIQQSVLTDKQKESFRYAREVHSCWKSEKL